MDAGKFVDALDTLRMAREALRQADPFGRCDGPGIEILKQCVADAEEAFSDQFRQAVEAEAWRWQPQSE